MSWNHRYGTDGANAPKEYRKHGLNHFVSGSKVQIGFMRDLLVLGGAVIDGRKTVLLQSSKGTQYTFVPHLGLNRLDQPVKTWEAIA